jgi:hypothetical protein
MIPSSWRSSFCRLRARVPRLTQGRRRSSRELDCRPQGSGTTEQLDVLRSSPLQASNNGPAHTYSRENEPSFGNKLRALTGAERRLSERRADS